MSSKIVPSIYTLKNGIVVGHVYTPSKDIFRMELIIRAGSLMEEKNEIGFAHFIEHLMSFYPSKLFPDSIKNQQELSARGIQMNAWTSEDTVGYWMEGLSDYKDLITNMILENYRNPGKPDKRIFRQEKNAVISELFSIINSGWYNLEQMIEYVQYPNTNLALTVEYEKNNVQNNSSIDNIMSFRDRLYIPELTTILIMSNDSNPDSIIKKLEKDFFPECSKIKENVLPLNYCNFTDKCNCYQKGSFGKTFTFNINVCDCHSDIRAEQENKIEEEEDQRELSIDKTFYYINSETESDTVKMEIHFPINFDSFDERSFVLGYIEHILSGGLGSRLYYGLRTYLGAVYHVFSGSHLSPINKNRSYFIIETETSPKKIRHVFDIIMVELGELIENVEEYISKNEIDSYRDSISLSKKMLNSMDSYNKYYTFYRNNIIWGRTMRTLEETFKIRENIKPADVLRVSKEIFDDKKMKVFYSGKKPYLLSKENKDTHEIFKYSDLIAADNKGTSTH